MAGGDEGTKKRLKLDELKEILRAADPAVLLITPRILRRIVQAEFKVPLLAVQIPHERCQVFDRQVLFRHAEQEELGIEPDRQLPPIVIVMARPTAEELAELDRDTLLLKFWRHLFHAHLHIELNQQIAAGRLTPEHVQQRIRALGQAEFGEMRSVLEQEGFLLPGDEDPTRVYIEFAATYLEIRYFWTNLLPTYFPAIRDFVAVDRLLALDVDADAVFHRTRLAGAPDPVIRSDTSSDESNDFYFRLQAMADRAAQQGDTIRAAILRTRAMRVAPAAWTQKTRLQAHAELEKLTQRLAAALGLSTDAQIAWLSVLPSLLDKADQGKWPDEARLLYDLQNVCVEHERKLYALDLVEWVVSAGVRPIQRELHSLVLVRTSKHLRSAAQRLTQSRIADDDRQQLGKLLREAVQISEDRLREKFRPILTDALHDVNLRPANAPERAGFNKLVEELLDRITDFGFFTFSDLRDCLARNPVKMADLVDPHSFWRGDALLRLDRRLATLMDGVYRRGEFYLRWLERISSLNFGTETGRFLTINLTVPFGGALVLLEGVEKLVLYYFNRWTGQALSVYPLWTFPLLGLFFLGLIHLPALRRGVREGCRVFGRALHLTMVVAPGRFFRLPIFKQIAQSWPFLLFQWYVLKPLVLCGLIWLRWPDQTWSRPEVAVAVYLSAALVLNSRLGFAVTEAIFELLVLFYSFVRFDMLRGLVRWTLWFFKKVSDAFELVLYSVDEWLRFKSGENRVGTLLRGVAGVLWFPIGYITRLYFLTMIEPSINPLKLPLSSLAAKFMFPLYYGYMSPWEAEHVKLLESMSADLGAPLASAVMYGFIVPTLFMLPSAFAFFVWEMQGNWRIFGANRPRSLRPVVLGSHGETMAMLLRPGIHSGTVPKLYANLRWAERRAYRTGEWRSARTYREALAQVEEAVKLFVEREMLALVHLAGGWEEKPLSIGRVQLANTRIEVGIEHRHLTEQGPLRLAFVEQRGWLTAEMAAAGWLRAVPTRRLAPVLLGMAGLYKLAGVDVLKEQVEAAFRPREVRFEMADHVLKVAAVEEEIRPASYNLFLPGPELQPRRQGPEEPGAWPTLSTRRLLFRQQSLRWQEWVTAWEREEPSITSVRLFQDGVTLARLEETPSRLEARPLATLDASTPAHDAAAAPVPASEPGANYPNS